MSPLTACVHTWFVPCSACSPASIHSDQLISDSDSHVRTSCVLHVLASTLCCRIFDHLLPSVDCHPPRHGVSTCQFGPAMDSDGIPPFTLEPAPTVATRWVRWMRRVENYLVAKSVVVDDTKRAMLLHLAGEEVFDINSSLDHIEDTTYDQLKVKLNAYFAPQINREYEVFLFRQAKQESAETLDNFHARLRRMVQNCEFADPASEIKSQIIQKCLSDKVRDKGLTDIDCSLDALLKYGRTLEVTTVQAKAMTGQNGPSSSSHAPAVLKLQSNYKPKKPAHPKKHWKSKNPGTHQPQSTPAPERRTQELCCGCGKPADHPRKQCPAWDASCYHCGKKHHFAAVCRSGGVPTNEHSTHRYPHKFRNYYVEEDPQAGPGPASKTPTDGYDVQLYRVGQPQDGVEPYICCIDIEGVQTTLEIDTGSASTLISLQTWQQFPTSIHSKLTKHNLPKLRTYSGEYIQPVGRASLNVRLKDKYHELSVLIVPGHSPNLLGCDWLTQLQLDWPAIADLNSVQMPKGFPLEFDALFTDELGTLKGVKATLTVDPDVPPHFCKARPVPYSVREKVERELEHLQTEGVQEACDI